MALVRCSECDGNVSEKARVCVHCGNQLLEDRPGFIGSTLRVLYWLFTAGIVIFFFFAVGQRDPLLRPIDRLLMVAIGAGIWFGVSLSIAVLLYVTRFGRVERVDGAIKAA